MLRFSESLPSIFLHGLQCRSGLAWDTRLAESELGECRNIAKQYNSAPVINISRSFGDGCDDDKLITFTDSSNQIYGIVLYLFNIRTKK